MSDSIKKEGQEIDDNEFKSVIFLSDNELAKINNLTLERKLINAESQIIAQKIENKKKEMRILDMQKELLQRDINELSGHISGKSNLDNDLKAKYSQLIQELSKKYNLPNKWGFHPETGEIVVD